MVSGTIMVSAPAVVSVPAVVSRPAVVSGAIRPAAHRLTVAIISWLLGLLLMATPAHALQLSQRVDRHIIHPDETLIFTVLADQPLPAEALNIRPLFAGFSIGQLQFTTTHAGQQSRWVIPLTVRADQPFGPITLPALSVANRRTNAIALRYQAGTPAMMSVVNHAGDTSVVEGSLLQAPAYPGSAGLYRLRIKLLPGITIDKIAPPMLANATVTAWGEDQRSTMQINGNQVPVVDRLYLLRPQQSGHQTLLGAQVEGVSGNPRPGTALRQATPDMTLDIAPLPADAPSLPSEQLQLTAHWVTPPANGKPHSVPQVGEPLRFQVTLQGVGNLADDLPAVAPVDTPAWKIYLEQNQQQTRLQGSTLLGTRTLSYLAVPQQAGTHPLPALTLAWWNSHHHRQEMASTTLSAPDIAPAPRTSTPDTLPASAAPDGMTLLRYLAGLLCVAVASVLLWRVPYFARWRQRIRQRWQQHLYWRQIRLALQQHNAPAAHHAILAWARLRWPQMLIPGLTALPCYPALAVELDALLAACYAPTSCAWQGQPLLQGLQRWHPVTRLRSNPVNPDGLF